MTRYELLKSNCVLVDLMVKNQIKPTDIKYLALYEEFHEMKRKGVKVLAIVYDLADKYNCGKRTVYDIIRRFDQGLEL